MEGQQVSREHGICPVERKMCLSMCLPEGDSFGDPRTGQQSRLDCASQPGVVPQGRGATPPDGTPDSGRNPITPEDVQTRPLHAGGGDWWASGIRDGVEFSCGRFLARCSGGPASGKSATLIRLRSSYGGQTERYSFIHGGGGAGRASRGHREVRRVARGRHQPEWRHRCSRRPIHGAFPLRRCSSR